MPLTKITFTRDFRPFSSGREIQFVKNEEQKRLFSFYAKITKMADFSDRLRIDCLVGNNWQGKTRIFESLLEVKNPVASVETDKKVELQYILDDMYFRSPNRERSLFFWRSVDGSEYPENENRHRLFHFFTRRWVELGIFSKFILSTNVQIDSVEMLLRYKRKRGDGLIFEQTSLESHLSTILKTKKLIEEIDRSHINIELKKILKQLGIYRSIVLLEQYFAGNGLYKPDKKDFFENYRKELIEIFSYVLRWIAEFDLYRFGQSLREEFTDQERAYTDALNELKNLQNSYSTDGSDMYRIVDTIKYFRQFLRENSSKAAFWNKIIRIGKNSIILLSEDHSEILRHEFRNHERLDAIRCLLADFTEVLDIDFLSWNKTPLKLSWLSAGQCMMFFRLGLIYERINELQELHRNQQLNLCVLVDEPDLHLHLEKQKEYVKNLVDLFGSLLCKIEFKDVSVQFILATHSPFVISDIPWSNLLLLNDGAAQSASCFWDNYVSIIRNGFFFKDKKLLWSFSEFIIDELAIKERALYEANRSDIRTNSEFNELWKLKEQIKDQFLKDNLLYFKRT